MAAKYASAAALRNALEERLRKTARNENTDIMRLRRQVAFDRLLARLFHGRTGNMLLKGGYALELRLERARATKDIDLSIRIRQNQRKVYFVPEAGALHLWGEGANVSPMRRSWHHHVAVWKFFMKHYPNGFSLLVLPAALFVNFTIRAFTGLDSK